MNGSLFLAPENPEVDFSDHALLKQMLVEIGLIQPSDSNICYCGENFTQLITFMGCSPHLVFKPPDDGSDSFCHVRLHHYDSIMLFTGQQTAPPRCPSCRHRLANWKDASASWHDHPRQPWECPECKTSHTPATLDWRQSGGSGKLLIEIKNIFPGEAVPVDRLLGKLREISSQKWRYFYIV